MFYILLLVLHLYGCKNHSKDKITNKLSLKEQVVSDSLEKVEGALSFFVIGDWGRNGEFNQKELAEIMNLAAKVTDPGFIISTGDNFYPQGVASINDYRWISSFESIYSGYHLQYPWYVVLGNHDYEGNINAQIAYTDVSRRWNMPSQYYTLEKKSEEGTKVTLVFIDTIPFELKYYEDERFVNTLAAQDTTHQLIWIDSVLASSDADFKIVVGHHPIYSGLDSDDGDQNIRKQLEPILKKHAVDLYLSGHHHNLQHIKPEGFTQYIISGAGSELRSVKKKDYSLFAKSIQGFVSVSIKKTSIKVQMIDYKGNLIYKTNIEKQL